MCQVSGPEEVSGSGLEFFRKCAQIFVRFWRSLRDAKLVLMRPSAALAEAVRLQENIHKANNREDARNFHLPDGTTLVTMHASSNLDLDVHFLGLN